MYFKWGSVMKKFGLALFICLGITSADVFAAEEKWEVDCLGPGVSPIATGEMEIGGSASGFYAFADFTYWYSDLGGIPVVLYRRTTTPQPLPQVDQESRPGFKVGLGFFTPSSGFDVNAQYTWFYNKQGRNQYTTTNLTGSDEFLGRFQTAAAAFGNVFNRLDLTVGKDVFFGKYFMIAPGGGFFGIWGNFWFNLIESRPASASLTSYSLYNHQNFWGVGPYFNLKAKFIYPSSFLANSSQFVFFMQPGMGFSWAALQAYYNQAETGTDAANYAVTDRFTATELLLDGVIGISWEVVNIQKVLSNFAFTIAWEIQQYQDLNIITDQGDSWAWTAQGLTTGLNFRF